MSKRTLDSFFSPPSKRAKTQSDLRTVQQPVAPPPRTSTIGPSDTSEAVVDDESDTYISHVAYPQAIRNLPSRLSAALQELVFTATSKAITNQPHLNLLYFQPLIPQPFAGELFDFLRTSLPFYRVCYTINRFGKSTQINTPRFTTVFGIDATSHFKIVSATPSEPDPRITRLQTTVVEAANPAKPVPSSKYKCIPRPIPPCLAFLLNLTEALTNETYNFCLVNYYASGADSISYHSDDERFLGPNPAIASITLGARRDFLMKHKPTDKDTSVTEAEVIARAEPLKLSLSTGDMILMRGETQSRWLHSIPKRKGGEADKGRINITMRKAMVPGGTENYYTYNVGSGGVHRWDARKRAMVPIDVTQA